MSGRVRVTRIIEIEYENQERFELDRQRWALPANGVCAKGLNLYKTATFLSESIGEPALVIAEFPTRGDLDLSAVTQ